MSFEDSCASIDSYFLGLKESPPPQTPKLNGTPNPTLEECREYDEKLRACHKYHLNAKVLVAQREAEFEQVFYNHLNISPTSPFSRPFFLHCKESTKAFVPSEAIVFGREVLDSLQ